MTRRTGEDVLTREEADRRIRGTARVASALCWVAAALALALAAWSLFAAAWVTWSSARASGTDLVTAFLTTSEASGDFVLAETEPQDPVYRYDDEGNVVGMAQTGAGTVSLRGNPLQLTVRGVVSAGLSGAAFALAALLCGRVRRTGEVFSPRRARELGAVGWLLLLAGVLPPLVLNVAWPVVDGLTRSLGLSYSMSLPVMREDFVLCAAGLLLMAVARMFEYGCILQEQDDELL